MSSYGHQRHPQYATLDERLREADSHQPSFHIRPIPAEATSKVIFTNQQSSLPAEDSCMTRLDLHPGTRQASQERSPVAAAHLPHVVHSLVSEGMDTTEEVSNEHR